MGGHSRPGANLWTCSIVALNPDTGKMVWYFQASPHDTHDWDGTQTPVLIDGEFNGQPRKLLAQANRNGYYFLLDRTNGKNLVSEPFANTNWSMGVAPTARQFLIRKRSLKPTALWLHPLLPERSTGLLPASIPRRGCVCGFDRDLQRFLSH